MCSPLVLGLFLFIVSLVLHTCVERSKEPFVNLHTKFNNPLELRSSKCTRDKSKCCPALYDYSAEKCGGFEFARPSNFNDTITLTTPTATPTPQLPTCKVNQVGTEDLAAMNTPQHLMFGSSNLSSAMGREAATQMTNMCAISAKADTAQSHVDALNQVIQAANASAENNLNASEELSARNTEQKNEANRMWASYCRGYKYRDKKINNVCHKLLQFVNSPSLPSVPDASDA